MARATWLGAELAWDMASKGDPVWNDGSAPPGEAVDGYQPGASDDVTISDGTPSINNDVGTIKSLSITTSSSGVLMSEGSLGVSGSVSNHGSISLSLGSKLNIQGSLDNVKGAGVSVFGSGSKVSVTSLDNLGGISVSGDAVFAIGSSLGKIQGQVTVGGGGILKVDAGAITGVAKDATLTLKDKGSHIGDASNDGLSGLSSNAGSISLTDVGSLAISDSFSNAGSFTFASSFGFGKNAHLTFDGALTNSGSVFATSASHILKIEATRFTNTAAGLFILSSDSALTEMEVAHGGDNEGELRLNNDAIFTADGHFTNSGKLEFFGSGGEVEVAGTFDAKGTISGHNVFLIDEAAQLDLAATMSGTSSIIFRGDGAKLDLGKQLTNFSGSIGGFADGDTIDLEGKIAKSMVYTGSTDNLTVFTKSGTPQQLSLDGNFDGLIAKSDGNHGTDIIAARKTYTMTSGLDLVEMIKGDHTIAATSKTFTYGDMITVDSGSTYMSLTGGGVFGLSFVEGISGITLAAGGKYRVTEYNANNVTDSALVVDAHMLKKSDSLVFDGSEETDGKFIMTGGDGKDSLTGGDQSDDIQAGKGNDVMKGNGGSDQFVFTSGDGKDTITDFDAKGSDHDTINFQGGGSTIKSYADLKAHHLTEAHGNLIIDAGHGDTITLDHVTIKSLSADDFVNI